ncbi:MULTISPECIES: MlaD family protein [Rhodococcus]|uniref:Mce family protein n=3 Tax=Rhodococcus TaxID=1827 RepID=X0R5H6_RHOWR|nr:MULTISPECIES: MlaD family protein [Rhodococcus]AII09211.1 mammalian cell entry protein [Rhodococcus opacus]MDI9950768.1 MlaD family protein [Rhodococcus sp. IEGM 1305]MDI9972838.1 MlaD family protein [Rhodococcus sp. IEGM 1307]MDV6284123.1 MlaD family protein [Rhodococcus jostii]GAF46205.1 Mce family protein [Rhodococcus wratislaviensis NBRC 100605]
MRSRLVRIQLVAFAIVAMLGLVYVGAKYVRLDNLLGFGEYDVNAQFKDSGGIFTNAEVTYRGVPVGRVGDLSLTADGINVELKISSGGPDIPASAKAVVANRSAIGEQYVDLQPDSDQGPFLEQGSVITEADTSTPVPVEQVLMATDGLVRSVPVDSLRTVVTQLGTAFNGKGEDLQTLADSLSTLTKDGLDVLPQTLALIRDSQTVLATQSDQSSAIVQFSSDLDAVAAQLRTSDPDLRAIIDKGIPASDEVGLLVNQIGPSLTTDLTNLAAVGDKLAPQAIALRPILMFLPAIAASASTVAPGDGTVHQGIVLETNNPPSCTLGYEGTQEILAEMKRQDPNFDDTQQDFPYNTKANCDAPQGSVTGVRSADRIVFADPDTIQPWDFKPKVMPDTLNLNPIATQLAPLLGVTPK